MEQTTELVKKWEQTGLLAGTEDKESLSRLLENQRLHNEKHWRDSATFKRISIPLCVRVFNCGFIKADIKEQDMTLGKFEKYPYSDQIDGHGPSYNLDAEAEYVALTAQNIVKFLGENTKAGDKIYIHHFVENTDGSISIAL